MCDGDFTLGSTPNVGDDIVGECNGVPPTNCRAGFWIQFPSTDQCFCVPECSDFDPPRQPGQDCGDSGTYICQHVVSSNGNNRAQICIPLDWNVCTVDGNSGAGGSGGQGGQGGQGGDPECSPEGDECSFDSDCCSDSCSFGECE